MDHPKIGRTVVAGFVGTLAMTMLMFGGPMMGIHFINGTIVFPVIDTLLLYRGLPGDPWLGGATWGVVLWFLAQAMVRPMMGMGFFSSKAPQRVMGVIGSLIGHLIYGVLLGAIAGRAAAEAAVVQKERRAA